jgi:phosphoketolase
MSQQGGTDWFVDHLRLNGFDPIVFDGRDPAAFAWAIFEMECRLEAAAEAVRSKGKRYPVPLPYGIAVAPKGADFYGEGTNLAHNLHLRLDWACHELDRQRVVLTAIGAYQLEEALKASARLMERGVPHSVVYMLEPGRFRNPRSNGEKLHSVSAQLQAELYPDSVPARLFVTHTRPEPLLGTLQPLNTGTNKTAALGFII